eukprot:1094062-Alexandrium_andersonii.AAC.1
MCSSKASGANVEAVSRAVQLKPRKHEPILHVGLVCGREHVQLGRLQHMQLSPTARAPSARYTCRAPLSRRRRRTLARAPPAIMAPPPLLQGSLRWSPWPSSGQ